MEFEEMKKIWDSQNNEPLYGINEKALHNRILSKKKQAYHITNISELLSIVAYAVTGCFILGMNLHKQSGNVFMYILSAWMLGSALYLLVSRIRRINGDHRFDRSMRGRPYPCCFNGNLPGTPFPTHAVEHSCRLVYLSFSVFGTVENLYG